MGTFDVSVKDSGFNGADEFDTGTPDGSLHFNGAEA